MTRAILRQHPGGPTTPIDGISADVTRNAAGLRLRYRAAGDIGALAIPQPAHAARVDELWKRTCFEVFLRLGDGDGYCEVNLAPSSQWAAYAFRAYRERAEDPVLPAPDIRANADGAAFTLDADLDLSAVAGLDSAAPWRIGLSAVIEDKAGERSYWALAHPPGKPDFHHPSAFVLHLPPPDRP